MCIYMYLKKLNVYMFLNKLNVFLNYNFKLIFVKKFMYDNV